MKPIIALLLLASTAQAAPIQVDFVRVNGPDSITEARMVDAIKDCSQRLSEATNGHASIAIASITNIPQYSDNATYLEDTARYYAIQDSIAMTKVLGLTNRRHLVHFVHPPILSGGFRWYAGRAQAICKPHGVSMSNAGANQAHSTVGICHELGHLLGMGHLNFLPATMMHPNALAYDSNRLEFSAKSIRQMRLCKKRFKKSYGQ